MSYKQHQYLVGIPDHPEAVVMIALMRARTFASLRGRCWPSVPRHGTRTAGTRNSIAFLNYAGAKRTRGS